ncbi:MAG: hypothetical protein AAF202_07680, partial [Pseudomonadota bacterium]
AKKILNTVAYLEGVFTPMIGEEDTIGDIVETHGALTDQDKDFLAFFKVSMKAESDWRVEHGLADLSNRVAVEADREALSAQYQILGANIVDVFANVFSQYGLDANQAYREMFIW